MNTLYLKNEYEDGTVFFKIDRLPNPEDEYIYEGTEIMIEDDLITKDEYELTEDDLQEMYDDGFEVIPKTNSKKPSSSTRALDLEYRDASRPAPATIDGHCDESWLEPDGIAANADYSLPRFINSSISSASMGMVAMRSVLPAGVMRMLFSRRMPSPSSRM
jgi:hypothetical protein